MIKYKLLFVSLNTLIAFLLGNILYFSEYFLHNLFSLIINLMIFRQKNIFYLSFCYFIIMIKLFKKKITFYHNRSVYYHNVNHIYIIGGNRDA